ncbi:DUF748 domain-containing protein [Labilibacter sediminis]|nr:DUF748 domain-containing protein [Labilibacter sediminis]
MRNIKKKHYVFGAIIIVLFLLLFFLSSIIKNYIVKNSEELIGRKLQLEELHINYLKVQITARNFTLYEENKKDTFVYFSEFLLNYDPWKMIRNEYAVSQIRLVNPYVYIQQNGETFNFDDLIPPADSAQVPQDTIASEEENVKFSIRNIDLQNGEFLYFDKQIDNLLEFDNLNLELPLIAWDSRSSEMGVQFSIGENGLVHIDAEINQQDAQYNINFGTEDIQLSSFTNYLKDYVHISDFKGLLQSEISIKGDLKQVDHIFISGSIGIDSLGIIDDKGETLFAAKSVSTLLDSIDLENNRFIIDKIHVDRPIISVVLNKEMTNWESFLIPILSDTLESASADSIATETIEEEPLFYKIDTISINTGQILLTDNTLNREFKYSLKDIEVQINDLYEKNDQIPLNFSIGFNNEGKYTAETFFSINNPKNFTYKGIISKIDLHSFSPYTEYYLGYPIVSGLFNYDCEVKMTPQKLKNDNHILVEEMEFGKNTKDATAVKLPVKLALYLIKDANDNVEIDLPVTGNPSEPGFKLGPLIWKTFGKFIVKTATQPFASLAKLVGTHPEELEMIPFDYTQDSLMNDQRKVLDKIAQILTKKEDLIFSFRQEVSVEDELMLLAEKRVKSIYITEKTPANITNWKQVSDNDEKFIKYFTKLSADTTNAYVKQKYYNQIPETELKAEFEALYKNRNDSIHQYLIKNKLCSESSIKISNVDFANMPQELKNPGFRVEVSVK